jgi:hypothetical protein
MPSDSIAFRKLESKSNHPEKSRIETCRQTRYPAQPKPSPLIQVERTGKGDQYGHPEEGGAVYKWLYELMEDDSWLSTLVSAH